MPRPRSASHSDGHNMAIEGSQLAAVSTCKSKQVAAGDLGRVEQAGRVNAIWIEGNLTAAHLFNIIACLREKQGVRLRLVV